jgi:predicted transglutaminase-like protease
MKNLIVLSISAIILMGCGHQQVKTVYQDKYIPIPIVPAPPEVAKPEYYSETLTDEQKEDIGELAKAYVIDSKQAKAYADNLERVYETYGDMATSSENRLKALESLGATVDRSLMEQASAEINTELKSLSLQIETNSEEVDSDIEELRQMKKPE